MCRWHVSAWESACCFQQSEQLIDFAGSQGNQKDEGAKGHISTTKPTNSTIKRCDRIPFFFLLDHDFSPHGMDRRVGAKKMKERRMQRG
jgi:hypothetical protein